ncbi:MAG: TIGR00266 family protein [Verrucomicrobiota bacterium]
MTIEIVKGPGNAAAHVTLEGNERITSEGGAMIAASGDLQVTTDTRGGNGGGFLKSMRRAIGGESFFVNHYTAPASGGELFLGTTLAGDMTVIDVPESGLAIEGGGFVAGEDGVSIDMSWKGFKSLFSGEGLIWLKAEGNGRVVVNSFGGMYTVDVDGEYIVDTGHIVAFENTLDFRVRKSGSSWLGALLGGEGLVCRFSGQGRVWCQSHCRSAFGRILGPKLKPRKKN